MLSLSVDTVVCGDALGGCGCGCCSSSPEMRCTGHKCVSSSCRWTTTCNDSSSSRIMGTNDCNCCLLVSVYFQGIPFVPQVYSTCTSRRGAHVKEHAETGKVLLTGCRAIAIARAAAATDDHNIYGKEISRLLGSY